ncbi:MAG: D-alanyl-D-alanine carboxypeptidase/D-alanyl-D-alanine-endopeptidase [Planctomycetes bacterium]|nr:D-alanyl-D-alanine carboxypeptidase/D-alanyl-D-alanine-endopeptidase [Planctomycetota bacterium]
MLRTAAASSVLLLAGCTTFADRSGLGALLRPHDDHAVAVAALVVDLDSGATVFAREAKRLLRPASTMKLLTTAAICRHDPDGVITTTLAADGAPAGAVTLFGGGDAFLSTAELRELVRELRRQGVSQVRGNRITVVDALRGAERLGEGWMWDDEPSDFMPPLSAVPVDGGCVTVEVSGAAGGLQAKVLPVPGPLRLDVAADAGPLRVTRGVFADVDRILVRGHLDDGGPVRRRLSVSDPARYTAALLAAALRDEGMLDGEANVTIVATAPPPATEVPRATLSRPVADAVRRTNKESDNLGAELLLRRLGGELDAGAAARGLAVLREHASTLGGGTTMLRLADGSGVSHYDLVSAELLVRDLVDMHRRGGRALAVFDDSLPIAGRDGTLAKRMVGTAAEGRVRAKTGTLSGVSNLAGYVTTASGRRLAFVILVQNFVGPAAEWRALQDTFCARLAAL